MSAKNTVVMLLLAAGALHAPARAAAQVQERQDESEKREGTTPLSAAESPEVPISFGGYFWVDSGFMQRTNRVPGTFDQEANYMQGRFVLEAGYERELAGLTAIARVQLLGLVNEFALSRYETHVLDAYVQVGRPRWDVQLGRFLAWEVYYRGQGIELYTAEEAGATLGPSMYLLSFTRGHMNGPGQAAIHLYPLDFLGLELAGVYGQEPDQQNYLGFRPVADVKRWGFELIGGYEYLKKSAQRENDKSEETTSGFAGRLQYRFGAPYLPRPGEAERLARGGVPTGVTVGVNFARANVDRITIDGLTDTDASLDRTSIGGFVDLDFWRSSIGLGYHHTVQENEQGEENTHDQAFVSFLYRLPIEGLSLKAVYGIARANIEDADVRDSWDNDLQSFRVRVAYEFR